MILSKTLSEHFKYLLPEVDLALFPSIDISLLWFRPNTKYYSRNGLALEIRDIRGH